jgi:purine-binding chemotaxis protein CheW
MGGQTITVLEFTLGDERYCIDISHVEEIVDAEAEITQVPNADPAVVGVLDLRGETTTIVDPKAALDLDGEPEGDRIVVLAGDEATGLLIDEVHEVIEADPDDVDESTAGESTRGVLRHEDRFVVWVDPLALS